MTIPPQYFLPNYLFLKILPTFANQTVGLIVEVKMKDTKEHILETAFFLFVEKTFKEVTMKEIVNATGLSKGGFYHYFESKEQLFHEVINDYLIPNLSVDYSQFDDSSLHRFYNESLDFMEKRATSGLRQNLLAQDGTYSNFYVFIFEAIKFFPELKEKFVEFDAYKLNNWIKVIHNAKMSGEIKSSMSDECIAKIFLSTIESTGIRLAMSLDDGNKKARLSVLWDSFYAQLKG
jgi:AcrR family transcriptional regulator